MSELFEFLPVSKEDMETMKGFPFTPVMAPTSSMKSGFPAAPVKAYRDHGINVALGTDNLCSSSADIPLRMESLPI